MQRNAADLKRTCAPSLSQAELQEAGEVKRLLHHHGVVEEVVGALQPGSTPPTAAASTGSATSQQQGAPHITLPAPSHGAAPGAAIRPSHAGAQAFHLPQATSPSVDPGRRHLRLHIVRGAAFMQHLVCEGQVAPHTPTGGHAYYVLHGFHRGQRFSSDLIPAATEPAFNTVFEVDMASTAPGHGALPPPAALLTVLEPLLLVLTMVEVAPGSGTGEQAVPDAAVSLVSTAEVEWRGVLNSGRAALTVELPPLGATAGMTDLPVGVLDLRMELSPPTGPPKAQADAAGEAQSAPLALGVPAPLLSKRLSAQASAKDEAGRKFFAYARNWWSEYCACGPGFK